MKLSLSLTLALPLTTGILLVSAVPGQAQALQRINFSAKLSSQAYGLPFRNVADGARNLGASVAVSYAYNQRQNLGQTVQLGVQTHVEQGNMYFVNTQVAYQPTLGRHLQPGIAFGVGRVVAAANPQNPYYEQNTDGTWQKSRQYQAHWQAPLTLSLGYKVQRPAGLQLTPFVDYQVTPIISYNDGFPLLPYGLLSVGTRLQFRS
jgi:hypothetical protein